MFPATIASQGRFHADGAAAFINSSALGYLIKTAKQLKGLDGELVLSEPSKFFQTTIKTLGIPGDPEAVTYFHDRDGAEEGTA